MSLEAYSKELGLDRIIQVEELIESHRSLVKELNQSSRKEFKENLHKAYQQAYQDGLNGRFIEIEKLKNMTIAELVEKLKE